MAAIASNINAEENGASVLLSGPTGGEPFTVERTGVSKDNFMPKSTKFTVKGHNFRRQFSHLYFKRLEALKPRVSQQTKKKFSQAKYANRVIELKAGEEVYAVTGTLYKHMKLKPCVLDEFTNEAILQGLPPPKANYMNEEDSLILEDESGRVSLILDDSCEITVDELVSGVVAGVCGTITGTGELQVKGMCFAGMPSQHSSDSTARKITETDGNPALNDDQFVLFVSGMSLGGVQDDLQRLQLNLLCDYISGHVGSPAETKNTSSKISRVVVVGDSIRKPAPRDDRKAISREEQELMAAPLREADSIFAQIARSVPIDVMPGDTDPSNLSLPQQPLHNCLFPRSSGYKDSFHTVTNPYRFQAENVNFLGHSGQPVSNIKKFSNFSNDLDVLQRTLEWQHLAPTAPDTLACYPFYKRDPFVLDDKLCPHVLFSGNMDAYDDRLIKGENGQMVRLIAIPKFSESRSVVLLNLKTLESSEMTFQLDGMDVATTNNDVVVEP